jgi:hypothetical protein
MGEIGSEQPRSWRVIRFMIPVITGIRSELRGKRADRLQRCWHVRYQLCGLSAEITVYAETEAEARAKAADELRLRGLKVA